MDYLGFELRRRREKAGMTLKELGSSIFCTGSPVGRIDTAHVRPAGRARSAGP